MDDAPTIVLASASPRRADLLRSLGHEPLTIPTDIDETVRQGEDSATYVRRMANEKLTAAHALTRRSKPDPGDHCIVVAADTTVVLDGSIIGKPTDERDAAAILDSLSGRTHRVLTGVALDLCREGSVLAHRETVETTSVGFRELSGDEILRYISTGEPMDKAGAYGIQSGGGEFVELLDGSLSNVIGLPTEWLTLTLANL